ncbi:MAG: hypothetical protein LBJ71_01910 [Holosporaceae bacterium]|jgi:hypothetical protein|nr:hypothetical protein [Holosporaceae bacterium]
MKKLLICFSVCFLANTNAMEVNEVVPQIVPQFTTIEGVNEGGLAYINKFVTEEYIELNTEEKNEEKKKKRAELALRVFEKNYPRRIRYVFWKVVEHISEPTTNLTMLLCTLLPSVIFGGEIQAIGMTLTAFLSVIAIFSGKVQGYSVKPVMDYTRTVLLMGAMIDKEEGNALVGQVARARIAEDRIEEESSDDFDEYSVSYEEEEESNESANGSYNNSPSGSTSALRGSSFFRRLLLLGPISAPEYNDDDLSNSGFDPREPREVAAQYSDQNDDPSTSA